MSLLAPGRGDAGFEVEYAKLSHGLLSRAFDLDSDDGANNENVGNVRYGDEELDVEADDEAGQAQPGYTAAELSTRCCCCDCAKARLASLAGRAPLARRMEVDKHVLREPTASCDGQKGEEKGVSTYEEDTKNKGVQKNSSMRLMGPSPELEILSHVTRQIAQSHDFSASSKFPVLPRQLSKVR